MPAVWRSLQRGQHRATPATPSGLRSQLSDLELFSLAVQVQQPALAAAAAQLDWHGRPV